LRKNYNIYLFLILLGGFFLRVTWIGYSLPQPGYFSSDEIDTIGRTLKIATGDLTPSHYNKPAFFNIVSLVIYGLVLSLSKILGFVSDREDLIRLFIQNPTVYYLAGRIISVIAGVMILLLVYRIGTRIKNRAMGLIAALLMACCYTSVQFEHMAKEDTLLTFLIYLTLWCSIKAQDTGKRKYLLWGGLCSGLAAATKYTGILSILFPVLFLLSSWKEGEKVFRKTPGLILIFSGALIGFCVGMPFSLLHPLTFMKGVFSSPVFSQISWKTIWLGGERHFGFVFILKMFKEEFGSLMAIIGGLSFSALISYFFTKREDPERLFTRLNGKVLTPILVFTTIFLLVLFSSGHLDYQYILPISPFWALLSSLFLVSLYERKKIFMFYAIFFLIIQEPLYHSVKFDMETLGTDTRIKAAEWMDRNISPGDKIAFDTDYYYQYHPPIRLSVETIRNLKERAKEKGGTGTYFQLLEKYQRGVPLYHARFLPMPTWLERLKEEEIREYHVEKLKKDGFRWVVISSYYFDRIRMDPHPGWKPIRRFYEELKSRGKKAAQFAPASWINHGPELIIYHLGD